MKKYIQFLSHHIRFENHHNAMASLFYLTKGKSSRSKKRVSLIKRKLIWSFTYPKYFGRKLYYNLKGNKEVVSFSKSFTHPEFPFIGSVLYCNSLFIKESANITKNSTNHITFPSTKGVYFKFYLKFVKSGLLVTPQKSHSPFTFSWLIVLVKPFCCCVKYMELI